MIKDTFSIKDLENLSGIKAHTIRIWEKRYNLLAPMRSDTNIRYYDLRALQKILNVGYLKNTGSKISAIASLTEGEIENEVRAIAQKKNKGNHLLQELKLAMVNFNEPLFDKVFNAAIENNNFSGVFYELFIPFLQELGDLWQSNTITIAHEHFISNLIKQKMLVYVEQASRVAKRDKEGLYILFLPHNEIHDIGLLFLNYKLLMAGYKTVYLGASMPLDSLTFFQRNGQRPTYMTFITVSPSLKKVPQFLERFNKKLDGADLILMGSVLNGLDPTCLTENQNIFTSFEDIQTYIGKSVEKVVENE